MSSRRFGRQKLLRRRRLQEEFSQRFTIMQFLATREVNESLAKFNQSLAIFRNCSFFYYENDLVNLVNMVIGVVILFVKSTLNRKLKKNMREIRIECYIPNRGKKIIVEDKTKLLNLAEEKPVRDMLTYENSVSKC